MDKTVSHAPAEGPLANSTADKVIEILLLFDERHPTWTASDLGLHLKIPRSTLYRYLNSLRKAKLLVEQGDGIYKLGPKIQLLATIAKASTSLIEIAREEMLSLSEAFNETVLFNERVDYDIATLERIESRHRLRLSSTRGSLLPWPATPSSKVLLAFASAPEIEQFWSISHPVAYTPNTITDKDALLRELDTIRQRGYAYSDEERDEGIIGIAVPVSDGRSCHHCISIVAPKFRIADDMRADMRRNLLAAASNIRARYFS